MAIIQKSTNNKCYRGCGEKGALLHVGRNVNWCSCYAKQYGDSLKKKNLKIELPYDPTIPLSGIYPEKMKTVI